MAETNYLRWIAEDTPTAWWHDSGDPQELELGRTNGAVGVTTNPVLSARALKAEPGFWRSRLEKLWQELEGAERAEVLMKAVVQNAAEMFSTVHRDTGKAHGYVCAQVNPNQAGERETMIEMARRFHNWAPNIAVKLPVTAAGLDVLEECVAEGITITATVSFTVPQVLAVAERHRAGVKRATAKGIEPGRCFAVIMIGRIDDYLREVAHDRKAPVEEEVITQAGLAISKRAYRIYRERGYEATLLVAAMRGTYHMTELAGGELILSIHPKYQDLILQAGVPCEQQIEREVDPKAIEQLRVIPEFVRAYEPEGMEPEEFITFGVTQKTLTQFYHSGWALLETYAGE
jgi:transaldolase